MFCLSIYISSLAALLAHMGSNGPTGKIESVEIVGEVEGDGTSGEVEADGTSGFLGTALWGLLAH